MRKILFCFFFNPLFFLSQDPFLDTTKSFNPDSLNSIDYETNPNYIGFNVNPLISGIINSRNNYNIKISAMYKRNFGYKNLRLSLNYLTEGNSPEFDFYYPVSSSDSSVTNRYFNSDYSYTDFRFGFEELRGYSGTRVHVGIDAIIGYGSSKSNYFDRLLIADQQGNYVQAVDSLNNSLFNEYKGNRINNYMVTGLDVSFGLDWIINDLFIFTVQITPQFNYFILLNEKLRVDPKLQYTESSNFVDFRLGYLDLNLVYKF
jgi:hypothetical protein